MNVSITINKCIGESSPVYLYCSKFKITEITESIRRSFRNEEASKIIWGGGGIFDIDFILL